MQFQTGNNHGSKKKGKAEYRSLLTREAYERDPAKCAKAIDNIIDGAVNLDPVCVKAFSQSYMTKAPAEEDNQASHFDVSLLLRLAQEQEKNRKLEEQLSQYVKK